MVDFQQFTLDNGLRVVVHEDPDVQIAVVNILYNVGSRDENPEKTGFAHLFEHLMFGGSVNIPDYDEELQKIGGENNAFTSPDITNYYMTLPAQSLETGFWLESDRMLALNFNPDVLEVQRKVVIEEFKQRYLNQPYGDVWLKLRPLAYHQHPYQWPTIGKDIRHIEDATMEQVRDFFYTHYRPDQAILVVAGNVNFEEVRLLADKWFGPIPSGKGYVRNLPAEPRQHEYRRLECSAEVPSDALYMCFHVPGRFDDGYYAADLLSDIIGRGKSSRLYSALVSQQNLFTSINAYMTGSLDPGLLVISGQLASGISIEKGETAVFEILDKLKQEALTAEEVEKVRNQAESTLVFGEVEVLNRAMNLAVHTLNGDTAGINREAELIRAVTAKDISAAAEKFIRTENCSVLHYHKDNHQ
ncbi:MAG: pitrilysin family protein [Cyclobacteriaceae bacterium]